MMCDKTNKHLVLTEDEGREGLDRAFLSPRKDLRSTPHLSDVDSIPSELREEDETRESDRCDCRIAAREELRETARHWEEVLVESSPHEGEDSRKHLSEKDRVIVIIDNSDDLLKETGGTCEVRLAELTAQKGTSYDCFWCI